MAESRLQNTSPRGANLVRQLNKYRHRRPIRFFGGGSTVHEPAGLTLSTHCSLSRKRQNVTIFPSLSLSSFSLASPYDLDSCARVRVTHLIKSN